METYYKILCITLTRHVNMKTHLLLRVVLLNVVEELITICGSSVAIISLCVDYSSNIRRSTFCCSNMRHFNRKKESSHALYERLDLYNWKVRAPTHARILQ